MGTWIASPVTALSAYKSFYINIFRQQRFTCTDTLKPTQTCFAQKLIQITLPLTVSKLTLNTILFSYWRADLQTSVFHLLVVF